MIQQRIFHMPDFVAPKAIGGDGQGPALAAGSGSRCILFAGTSSEACPTLSRVMQRTASAMECAAYYVQVEKEHIHQGVVDFIDAKKPTWVFALGADVSKAFSGTAVLATNNPASWQVAVTQLGTPYGIAFLPPVSFLPNVYIARQTLDDINTFLSNDPASMYSRMEGAAYTLIGRGHAAELRSFVDDLGGWVVLDTETTGTPFCDLKVFCLSLSNGRRTVVVSEDGLADPLVIDELKRLTATRVVVGHNMKYDYHAAKQGLGIDIRNYDCTRLLYKLVRSDAVAKLDHIGLLVGVGGHKKPMEDAVNQVIKLARKAANNANAPQPSLEHPFSRAYAYAFVDRQLCHRYVAGDAWTTANIYLHLKKVYAHAKERGYGFLRDTWRTIVKPFMYVAAAMEEEGLHVDLQTLDEVERKVATELDTCVSTIDATTEGAVQPSKNDTIREFFEGNGIDTGIRTSTGKMSVSAEGLTSIADQSPLAQTILDYRAAAKLANSYLRTLRESVRPDGKVHPDILIDGTRTGGRISVRNPALQTIPPAVRPVFVGGPTKDWMLITSDYKTLEIFVAAAWSGDQALYAALNSGIDFHTHTAMLIAPTAWKMTPEAAKAEIEADLAGPDKSSKKRADAKRTAFAVLYGMGAHTLSKTLKCSLEQAQALIDGFFGAYRTLEAKFKKHIANVEAAGCVVSKHDDKLARIRWLYELGWESSRGHARNAAVNMPIQAQAADICTSACIQLHDIIKNTWGDKAAVALTIHDSIVVRAHVSVVDDVASAVRSTMENQPCGGLRLKVDQKIGYHWS